MLHEGGREHFGKSRRATSARNFALEMPVAIVVVDGIAKGLKKDRIG